jgi:hypothetical protein
MERRPVGFGLGLPWTVVVPTAESRFFVAERGL